MSYKTTDWENGQWATCVIDLPDLYYSTEVGNLGLSTWNEGENSWSSHVLAPTPESKTNFPLIGMYFEGHRIHLGIKKKNCVVEYVDVRSYYAIMTVFCSTLVVFPLKRSISDFYSECWKVWRRYKLKFKMKVTERCWAYFVKYFNLELSLKKK